MNFKTNKNNSNSGSKIKNNSQSKLNSRQKSENVFKIDIFNLNSLSLTKNKTIEKNDNSNINFANNINQNHEEFENAKPKQFYIKIIKEKDREISKLKSELDYLKKLSNKNNNNNSNNNNSNNINISSYRPVSFRYEDKKNSFEINKSATIEKLSRISNKSPNQNSFLKGFNSTLSTSSYSHRISYFSPKGKKFYPYNNRNIDISIGYKNSMDFEINNNKYDIKENLDKIFERTKNIFERYENLKNN